MRTRLLRSLVALVAITAATPFAYAGRSCEQHPPSAVAVSRAMQLAEHTATRLTQSGASVVVIARAGQNLSEYGLRYSHLGFAYREGERGPWRVVHKLNQCGSSRASLYRHGLGEYRLGFILTARLFEGNRQDEPQMAVERLNGNRFLQGPRPSGDLSHQ